MKVMAIYAHPADIIADCGGALAMHVDKGDDVVAIIISHGARIHPNKYVEEQRKSKPDQSIINAGHEALIEGKKQEMQRAADILGIQKVICFDEEDNLTVPDPAIITRISMLVAEEKPDVVVMDHFSGGPYAGCHEMASAMAMSAVLRAGEFVRNLDGIDAHHVKQIYFSKVQSFNRDCLNYQGLKSDIYVDITPVAARKLKAVEQFASQAHTKDVSIKTMEAIFGAYGTSAKVNFAEGYMRYYPETHAGFPVTEYADKTDPLTAHVNYSKIRASDLYEE